MKSLSTTHIDVEIKAPVARVALTHPPLNIIDMAMARELAGALGEIECRHDISVLVFESSGPSFSAGVDIKAHQPDQVREMLTNFHNVIRTIAACRKITIAVVHGKCLGGGAELALVCDMVYTARDATWGFPEIKLGCYPPVATVALAAVIGQKKASELILTGRQFSGDEAKAIGLVNRSVDREELASLVEELLDGLRALSPAALAHAKRAIYAWDAIHFDKGLARAEKIYLEELISTEDAREGIIAFLEKRPPLWTGK